MEADDETKGADLFLLDLLLLPLEQKVWKGAGQVQQGRLELCPSIWKILDR